MTKLLAATVVATALTASIATVSVADGVKADVKSKLKIEAKEIKEEASTGAKIGEAAPQFTLHDQDGNAVTLADFEGKVVVLEWTNPDCPFVQRHYADDTMTMKHIADEYADKDVVWLAVNSTHYFDQDKNKSWKAEKDLPFAVLSDVTGKVGHLYGAMTTPHMFIVDASGNLAYSGAIDDDPRGNVEEPSNYVRASLDAILAGDAPQMAQTKPYGCSVKYAKPAAS